MTSAAGYSVHGDIDVAAIFVVIAREQLRHGNVAFVDELLRRAKRHLVGPEIDPDLADAVAAITIEAAALPSEAHGR